MKIVWTIEDGYIGPSRPHTTEIDDEDLEACNSEAEREDYIDSCIRDDFEQKVSWREISRE